MAEAEVVVVAAVDVATGYHFALVISERERSCRLPTADCRGVKGNLN